MPVLTSTSALAPLADALRSIEYPLADNWYLALDEFRDWADQPELRSRLRAHLRDLSTDQATDVIAKSRETTTHFAWCLLDEPGDEFSFWLHEYKPQQDWRPGYADSVHNHRYHFCTTLLRGSYLHELYDAEVDPVTGLITGTTQLRRSMCQEGTSGVLLADEFHRIPSAAEETMTFLVKSRPVSRWSLSYDPETRTSHRHVPVETRLGELTQRI
jgi:hypothetical protein